MNVPGNAAISFDTNLTQAELETRLAGTDILGVLASQFGAYPVVTVEENP